MSDDELRQSVHDLNELLVRVGEKRWSEWSAVVLTGLADGTCDRSSVRSVFAGMGSLNDLVIHPANGHTISVDEVAATNEELDRLLRRVWELSAR